MYNLEQIRAFVRAAELGSFSAAARHLNKAQSAVSTAVMNLEIDLGVELFDRSGRNPQLTQEGSKLLDYARSLLQSSREFEACAASTLQVTETQLCIAIEQGIFVHSLLTIFEQLGDQFPYLEVEILDPGVNDVARLLEQGRADIGLMMEQEDYPQGFYFRGIGHSKLVLVCSPTFPLADKSIVSHADLRQHRQLLTRSRALEDTSHKREQRSPKVWYGESPFTIIELLSADFGWALLPQTVVAEKLKTGQLVRLSYDFQQSDILQGVDVVWTKKKQLGSCGQWLLNQLLNLDPQLWSK